MSRTPKTAGKAPAEAAALTPPMTALEELGEGMSSSTTTKARRVRKPQQPRDVPAYARLSFVQGHPTRYGWTGENWFSVPDDADESGFDGLLAFQELQQYVKANGGGSNTMNRLIVQWALVDAFKAKSESDSHAAQAFICCVAEFATAMMASDTGACVAWKIEQAQNFREQVRVFKAARRAEFVERMQAARAAKRVARQAPACAGAHPGAVACSAASEGVAT